MNKVVIKILQGNVVTQSVSGGLTIYPPLAYFLQCICAKNYASWLAVHKVIALIINSLFFGPPGVSVCCVVYRRVSEIRSTQGQLEVCLMLSVLSSVVQRACFNNGWLICCVLELCDLLMTFYCFKIIKTINEWGNRKKSVHSIIYVNSLQPSSTAVSVDPLLPLDRSVATDRDVIGCRPNSHSLGVATRTLWGDGGTNIPIPQLIARSISE